MKEWTHLWRVLRPASQYVLRCNEWTARSLYYFFNVKDLSNRTFSSSSTRTNGTINKIMFLCESQRPANRITLLQRPRQRFVLRPDSFASFSGACEFLASSPNSALPQALFFIDLHAGPVTHRQYPPPLFEDAVSLGLAPFPLKSCEERAEVLPR